MTTMMGSQATLPGIGGDAPATTIGLPGAIEADRPAGADPTTRRAAPRRAAGDFEAGRDEWVLRLKSRHECLPGWPGLPAAQRVLMELERTARSNPYAFPSNARLVAATGLSPRMIQIALRSLEQLGWIRSVFAGPGGRQRRGFIMLRRVTLDTPAAESAESVERVEAFLRSRKYGQEMDGGIDPRPDPLRSGDGNALRSRERNGVRSRERNGLRQNKDEARTKTKSKPASHAGELAFGEPGAQEPEPLPAVEAESPPQSQPAPTARAEPRPPASPPSAEALEMAAWAKGHRPELERVALALSRDHQPAWVRAAIEGVIVNRDMWPNNPTAYLGKILAAWKRAGTCEAIPGSTLANPTGARPAAVYHQVDPARRRPQITREEFDRNLAQLRDKPRHAPAAAQS